MEFLLKLDSLMENRKLNKRRLSLQSGIPYTTIDGWYKRGYENISMSTFKTLCAFFGVTMESMAYDDRDIEYEKDVKREFPDDESVLLRGYRAASKDTRSNLLLLARQSILAARERTEISSLSPNEREDAV